MADATYSGDAALVDGASFAAGTGSTDVGGGVFNDSIANLGSGTVGAARLTQARALHVHLRDASGAVAMTAAAVLSDALANPTVSGIQTFGMVYDAADVDWDRMRAISGDAQTNEGILAAGVMGFNGTTYDRVRVSVAADNIALPLALDVNAVTYVYDGTNVDLMRAVPALDAAPNVDTGILAVGIGPGWDRKQNPAGVAATSTANAITVVVDGADVVTFQVTTIGVTPGSMIIETTNDDSAWTTAGAVLKLGAETWVQGAFVPAVNDVYIVRTTGLRQVRFRVNAVYASGTVTVKWTGSVGAAMVKSIDVGAGPHNIGYAITSKTAQYTTTQTGVALWTPASGKRIVITSYQIQVAGTVAGDVQLWFGASGDTAYTRGTDLAIFDGTFKPSATSAPGVVQTGVWLADAVDRVLRVTGSAAINPLTVTVWGYETT